MDDDRTLTDGDVKAIAAQIEQGITQRFQLNVGRGVLGFVWRAFLYLLIMTAAYGAGGGFKKIL
ncbi:hypothetical protein [Paraburkholderia kururiensis]|uniref:hypothetical protein n=1 Tax=Paraburkholderia kururiensis TaxID=984307 RepID=UPI00034DF0A7|nr:hypothetical protein [Paraburkholderia kururiensis]